MAKRIAKTNAPMLPIEENNPVHYIAKKKTTIFNSIKVGASPEQEIGRQELEKYTKNDQLLTIMDAEDRKMSSRLLVATETGNWKGVYAILHQGIQSDNCIGMGGYTPLHYAANRGHLEIVQILLQFGANIRATNADGETPLHLAAYNGKPSVVELLLDKGAQINDRTNDGETALFYACRKGNNRVTRMLLRRGTDRTIKNKYGDVAQDEATDSRTLEEFDPEALEVKDTFPLGQEELKAVFKFLDLRTLNSAFQVSDRWHRAADESSLWENLGISSRWEMMFSSSVGIGFVSPMTSLFAKKTRPSSVSSGRNRNRISLERPKTASK